MASYFERLITCLNEAENDPLTTLLSKGRQAAEVEDPVKYLASLQSVLTDAGLENAIKLLEGTYSGGIKFNPALLHRILNNTKLIGADTVPGIAAFTGDDAVNFITKLSESIGSSAEAQETLLRTCRFLRIDAVQVKGFAFEAVVGADLGATQASKVLKHDDWRVEIDLVIDGFFCQCKNYNGILDLSASIEAWVERAEHFGQPMRFYISQTTQPTTELLNFLKRNSIQIITYP